MNAITRIALVVLSAGGAAVVASAAESDQLDLVAALTEFQLTRGY